MPDGTLVAKIGNIVREDPILRFSKAGKAFAKFSLQVKPYVPKGEPPVEATYYEVTAFGSLAEHVAECMKKGYRVGVIGTGKLETWIDKQNQERTTKTILADFVGPDLRFVTAELHGNDNTPAPPARAPEPEYAEDEEPF